MDATTATTPCRSKVVTCKLVSHLANFNLVVGRVTAQHTPTDHREVIVTLRRVTGSFVVVNGLSGGSDDRRFG